MQVMRLQGEFYLSGYEALRRALPKRLGQGIVLLSVARVSLDDWIEGDVIRSPLVVSRTTAVRAVADSLHRPYETIRRHVASMIDQGLLIAMPQGVALNPTGGAADRLCRFYVDLNQVFHQLIADMQAFGIAMPLRQGLQPSRLLMTRHALDLHLEPLDSMNSQGWNWQTMVIWNAISVLQIRHVTQDPVLSRRYADRHTPTDLRRPVSLLNVAQTLDMAYGTVWNAVERLRKTGLIEKTSRGWLITGDNLSDDRIVTTLRHNVGTLLRHVRATLVSSLQTTAPTLSFQQGGLAQRVSGDATANA